MTGPSCEGEKGAAGGMKGGKRLVIEILPLQKSVLTSGLLAWKSSPNCFHSPLQSVSKHPVCTYSINFPCGMQKQGENYSRERIEVRRQLFRVYINIYI